MNFPRRETFKSAPILYAHRGACIDLPENTLEAFEAGLKQGADALELDIQCSSDGALIVFHDDDALRMCGINQEISSTKYAEIKKWRVLNNGKARKIPLLTDLLEAFPSVVKNIDIKPNSLHVAELAVETVRRHGQTNKVLLTSSHHRVLKKVRELKYEGPIGSSSTDVAHIFFYPHALLVKIKKPGQRVQVPLRQGLIKFSTTRFIKKCHRAGLLVDFWVINDMSVAKSLLDLGADGIMTDDPSAIIDAFAARRTTAH